MEVHVSISIGWLIIGAAFFVWSGAKLGVLWDRYWSSRVDYSKLEADKEALYKLSQGALSALVDWQERAIQAEAKLKQVDDFAEYIDG